MPSRKHQESGHPNVILGAEEQKHRQGERARLGREGKGARMKCEFLAEGVAKEKENGTKSQRLRHHANQEVDTHSWGSIQWEAGGIRHPR